MKTFHRLLAFYMAWTQTVATGQITHKLRKQELPFLFIKILPFPEVDAPVKIHDFDLFLLFSQNQKVTTILTEVVNHSYNFGQKV